MKIDVNGLPVYYDQFGRGQPLIWLHGWGSDRRIWKLPSLFKLRFNSILPDLPGHGESPLLKALTLDDYVEVLKSLIRQVPGQKPILICHSMGGRIAAKYIAQNPDAVSGLILISSAGLRNFSFNRGVKKAIAKVGKITVSILPFTRKFKDNIRKRFYQRIVKSDDYLEASANPLMKATFINLISEDLTRMYEKITVPTVIFWGENDTVLPISDGERINHLIRGSRLIRIASAGHFPFIDQRKKFYDILTDVLLRNG